MNAEYQRLEAEASEVQKQIDELVRSCGQMVAADFQKFETKIAGLHQRLAGLRQGMGQGQRTLSRWYAKDFEKEVPAPSTCSAFHCKAGLQRVLLEQRQSEPSDPAFVL